MEDKRVKTAMKTAVGLRNYQRARSRALTRLANEYPNVYKKFLEEEKRRDELEGKKWHSLSDNPRYRLGGTRESSGASSPKRRSKRGRPRRAKKTRNNGRKA